MRGGVASGRRRACEASATVQTGTSWQHLVGLRLHNTCFPGPETFQESDAVDPQHLSGKCLLWYAYVLEINPKVVELGRLDSQSHWQVPGWPHEGRGLIIQGQVLTRAAEVEKRTFAVQFSVWLGRLKSQPVLCEQVGYSDGGKLMNG